MTGVHTDDNLSWGNHIDHISNQVSKGIGLLSNFKHTAPQNYEIYPS